MRLQAHCSVSVTLTLGAMLVGGCSRTGLLVDDSYVQAPVGCTEGRLELTRAYPIVIFVLDRSTSMDTAMGGTGRGKTRWQALASALAATLPSIDSSVQIGALLFPAISSKSCDVAASPELTPQRGNVAKLLTLMQDSSPGGSTPTAAAIDAAAKTLLGTRASTNARALVLATDGGPDCNSSLDGRNCRCASTTSACYVSTRCLDDVRTVQRISEYQAQGLATYVIGIQSDGDANYSDVLDAMAVAGGRPQSNAPQQYYAARSEAELDTALTAIGQLVGTCVYLTTSVPNAGGSIRLTLDGIGLAATQWRWQAKSNGEILLDPDVCRQVLSEETPQLQATVDCAGR
jgi:hypothetical protein